MNNRKWKPLLFVFLVFVALVLGYNQLAGNAALAEFAHIETGSTVEWKTAVAILNTGEVEMAIQAHSLDVTLELKDGRSIHTVEPAIDDILAEITACGDPCSRMAIATE